MTFACSSCGFEFSYLSEKCAQCKDPHNGKDFDEFHDRIIAYGPINSWIAWEAKKRGVRIISGESCSDKMV